MASITAAELALLHALLDACRAEWLHPVMLAASGVAHWGLAFLVLGAALVMWRRDARSLMAWWRLLLAVSLTSMLVTHVFKPLMPRERPFAADATIEVIGARSGGSSMPSGHAATAVAGAYALSLLWPGGRLVAWALATLVVFSRLYLGVHYPSDVLVGALIGWAIAYFSTAGAPARVPVPATARG